MKTPENNSGAATAEKNNLKTNVQTVNRPAIPGRDKDHTPANGTKNEPASPEAQAAPQQTAETKATGNEQPAANHEKVNTAEVKPEVHFIKPALNLEQTVKAVESLHRKNIQRLAPISRIQTLEQFEVTLMEGSDELENNPYQGCKLIIEDDKRRQFVTNTPNLIRMVSQFIFDACVEKLAEIEANIVFPNA